MGEMEMGVVNGFVAFEGSGLVAGLSTEEDCVRYRLGGGGILEVRDVRRRQRRQIMSNNV